jgi:HK97 family phage portal protein
MTAVLAVRGGNYELRANAAAEWGNSVPPTNAEAGGFGATGMGVSQDAALSIATVYSCANLLSSSVANSPVLLLNNRVLRKAKELKPSPLLTEPYCEIGLFDWIVQFVASLAIRGNFYGQIISRDKKTLYPTQIKPIPADSANVERLHKGELQYRFFNKVVPLKDVFHVKLLWLPGMLKGVNPIEAQRLAFSKSLSQSTYGLQYFRNSANPSIVIQVKGDLSPDQTKKMVRSFMAAHQGINQSHLPAVVTGDTEIKPITITPQDSQFLESLQWSASEIASTIYRVPPHMVGLTERVSSWGKGIEQMELGFTKNTLQDYTGRYEAAMTLLHPPGQFVAIDMSHRLRGDTLERAQAGSLGTLGGYFTPNDARALFDLPALPDGDKLNSPINTTLLEKVMAEAEESIEAKYAPEPTVDVSPNGNGNGNAPKALTPAK